MSMLRHIRMAPSKESQRTASSRLQSLVKTWTAPLCVYTVPHRIPQEGDPDPVCRCRYPLYTLCTPRVSPYIVTTCIAGPTRPPLSNSGAEEPVSQSLLPGNGRVMWKGRRLWRGRATTQSCHPNVVPHRPACYRCDICDGFQETDGDVTGTAEMPAEGNVASMTGALAIAAPQRGSEAERDEDEEDEEVEEEAILQPISSDIGSTFMDDTEVAEVRYLDPFLVQVLGRPSFSTFSRQVTNEFYAQLRRSGISSRALATHGKQALSNSIYYAAQYRAWAEAENQLQRQRSKERDAAQRIKYLAGRTDLLELAAYTARFAVAVYGLPYELGYFNSFQEAAMLAAEPHRRYVCATSEEQVESMRRMLQGEHQDPLLEVVASRYSIHLNQPCYSIVLDHNAKRVVLAFRGTACMAEVVVDMTEGYAEVDLLGPASELYGVQVGGATTAIQSLDSLPTVVQARLGTTYNRVSQVSDDGAAEGKEKLRTRIPLGFYASIMEASVHVLPALRKVYALYPQYELIITGHSLGGILATLFHLFFCFGDSPSISSTSLVPFSRVQTVALAAAPVVEEKVVCRLNELLRAEEVRSGSRLITFSFGEDMVSRLQVRAIRNTFLRDDCNQANCNEDGKGEAEQHGTRGSGRIFQDVTDARLPTLAIPGTLLNTPDRLKRTLLEVPVEAAWRKQLMTTPKAVFHHFPVFYLRTIHRLRNRYTCLLAEATKVESLEMQR